MHSRHIGIGSVLLALSGACTAEPFDGPGPGDGELRPRAAPVEELCRRGVQIGLRTSSGCPNIGAWAGTVLFDEGTPWLADEDHAPVPEGLERYCRYRWAGPGAPSGPQVANLHADPGFAAIGPSCRFVGASADVLTAALGPDLRDIFHTNVGRVSAADLGLPGSGTPEPKVTVMVVDTVPNDPNVVPTSRHGHHMGNIIRDIACPDDPPNCRVEVGFVVGLPRLGDGSVDYDAGGIVGTLEDVALGIYAATRRWQIATASRGGSGRLIINLSVGAELDVFGGNAPDLVAARGSVRSALEFASCHGALIVAAAGNASLSCDATGPVLPAAWEGLAAPDGARCADFGVVAAPGVGAGYRSLVHAVGGLGLDLEPMPESRPGALPRLMASATHVAAGDPLRGGISGTSAAAAVTSAVAALVWAHRPELEASDVIGSVHDEGELLPGLVPDFGLPGAPPSDVRRVDACLALAGACSGLPLDYPYCPPVPLTCPVDATPASLAALQASFEALEPDVTVDEVALPYIDTSCKDACNDTIEILAGEGANVACAGLVPRPTDAFVNPTPNPIGCATCGIEAASATAHLSLHPDFEGVGIEDIIIKLATTTGTSVPIDIGQQDLVPTEYTKVPLDRSKFPTVPLLSGEITIVFDSGVSTNDPLWIVN